MTKRDISKGGSDFSFRPVNNKNRKVNSRPINLKTYNGKFVAEAMPVLKKQPQKKLNLADRLSRRYRLIINIYIRVLRRSVHPIMRTSDFFFRPLKRALSNKLKPWQKRAAKLLLNPKRLKSVQRFLVVAKTYQKFTKPFGRYGSYFTVIAALIILSAAPWLYAVISSSTAYNLSLAADLIINQPNTSLDSTTAYNSKTGSYTINPKGLKPIQSSYPSTLIGQPSSGLYSATLSSNLTKGINITDDSNRVSFSLTPQFQVSKGKHLDGHFIYPEGSGNVQAVYTAKSSELAEDIVVNRPSSNLMAFPYKLNLPTGMTSFQTADGGVAIEQSGNILFQLSAPRIIQSNGKPGGVKTTNNTKLILKKNQLYLLASNLNKLSYPITIDPSVTINSATNFLNGNDEGGNNITANQVSTGQQTGGVPNAWTAISSGSGALLTATSSLGAVVYNGYMYAIGGANSSGTIATVEYAPIGANGVPGTWTEISSGSGALLTATSSLGAVAYNGYLYAIGGNNGSALATVEYAPIGANGVPGTWTQISSGNGALLTATQSLGAVAYNGYLYAIGGSNGNGNSAFATVEYAPIGANGVPGAWTQISSGTGALLTATYSLGAVAYNGYLYAIGGYNGTSAIVTVEYAPIGANGVPGAWTEISSGSGALLTATEYFDAVVYNGYLYAIGHNGTLGTLAYVEYAPIGANGVPGAWTEISSGSGALTTGADNLGAVAYNGYLYAIGGFNGSSMIATVQYAPIEPAGWVSTPPGTSSAGSAWAATTTLPYYKSKGADYYPTSAGTVEYNGYVYEIGGYYNAASVVVAYAPLNSNGTVGAWTEISSGTGALLTATGYLGAVAYNGYLYAIGGETSGNAPIATVEYAPIGANGVPGAWTEISSGSGALLTATSSLGAVAYNGYLYAIGGFNGTSALATVEYAPIGANGVPGTWTAISSGSGALLTATDGFGAVAYNGYLYAIGGYSGSALATVEYAPIGANGVPGAWTQISSGTGALLTATSSLGAVAYNGYLYAIGGENSSNSSIATVEYAPIGANGVPGAWINTTSLPATTYYEGAVVYNGYIYSIGGYTAGTASGIVDYAYINNGGNGSPAAWTEITSGTGALPTATTDLGAVAYNGYLYAFGGYNTSSPNLATVEYALVGANGAPGAWTEISSGSGALLTGAYELGAVAYNGYLYAIGGETSGNAPIATVEYAPIGANGVPGAWTEISSGSGALLTATGYLGAVAYNGYLYAIGGGNGNGNSAFATVEYAPIGANGVPGAWTEISSGTGALLTAAEQLGAVAYNGYLYAIGGYNGTSAIVTVEYAPIGANGAPGAWTEISSGSGALLTATAAFGAVAYNGYMYAIGGYSAGYIATVEYAGLQTIPRIGHYSRLVNIGNQGGATSALLTATYAFGAVAYNGYLYAIGGNSGSALATVEYAPIGANGVPGTWTQISSGTGALLTATQSLGAVAYNGYLYAIGGANSSGSIITTVEYAQIVGVGAPGFWKGTAYTNGADVTPISVMLYGSNIGNPGLGGYAGIGGIDVSYRGATVSCPTFSPTGTVNLAPPEISTPFNMGLTSDGCGNTDNLAEYIWVDVTLDDSQTATFPDIYGNHTTITGIRIYYHPASSMRLRGGATFLGGSLQSLDAPPYTKQ